MMPHKLLVYRDSRNKVKEVSKGERPSLAIYNIFVFWGCPVEAFSVTAVASIETNFIQPIQDQGWILAPNLRSFSRRMHQV